MKATLLLADKDPRSLRILELALRKAGFAVATASESGDALAAMLAALPDLAICAAEWVPAVRDEKKLASVPLIAIGATKSAKSKAIEAGADEYLAKPILLRELVQLVGMLLERRRLQEPDGPAALTGSVADLGLLDVFQSLENWRKTAVVRCESQGQLARVWMVDGQIVDAELGPLAGEAAFWRLMTWDSGDFRVEYAAVEREPRMGEGTQAALMEAMRRVDELGRLAEQLPMGAQLAVDFVALAEKLADLPDEVNAVVRCFDGKRTLRDALDLSPVDDLSTVAVVQRLLADKILRAAAQKPSLRKPSLQQWLSDPPPIAARVAEAASPQDATAAAALVATMAEAEETELQKQRDLEQRAVRAVTSRPPAPVKPLPVVHFPPLRGVRRERLRRESDEARARIAVGEPVRLTHVVELPAWKADGSDAMEEARRMSPAVGEAAKRFAPDAPVARLVANGEGWEAKTALSHKAADHSGPELAVPAEALLAAMTAGEPEPVLTPTEPPPPAPVLLEKSDPAAPLPAVAPVIPSTPPPQVQAQLAAAMGAAAKKPSRLRWQLMVLASAAAIAAAVVFRPQPATDKKDAPWLAESKSEPSSTGKTPDALPGQPPIDPPPPGTVASPPPTVVTTSSFAPLPPSPDAAAYAKALNQGDALLRRGKYRAALGEFKRAFRLRPESVPALLALGDGYLEADLPRSAVKPLESAARLEPANGRAQLLLGTAYQSLGRNGDAVRAYQRYLELDPSGEFGKDVKLILANLSH